MSFDWNDIPLLIALARDGSMSAAGRALGIDPSTMSRRLAAAETALQTRLFIRDNAGYHPTEAGLVFLSYAERVSGDVKSMLLDTCSEAEGISGAVRITSIDFLFSHWLVDHMPALLEQYPRLQLQLLVGNQALSFTRREADFALRLARPQDDAALVMRKVGDIGFAVYGAERFANIAREQWAEQPWLAYGEELAEMAEMRWLREIAPHAHYPIRVSSVSTLVHACQTGVGLALLPCILGERNGLRRLSAEVEVLREVWLLSHRDAGKIGRYQAVSNWLKQVFEQEAAPLRGEPRQPAPPI
ncbi:LysR family transcriptional regulator [Aquipseudomonas ullengensis]|uniref:LysR family transcriptional regulator n=1 Tax=Aquipseudomonas ullengensis TaxID=2759166 RepID=A0A7W4LQW8_9GAMM|nr:LysR family transcriptional regulator [Pseudomonas ullengensis]MBB2497512.1 LysR family transcriptional regulator [Pseudomonas ullengensis]